jgi:hypothetical protein
VASVVAGLSASYDLSPAFALLAPESDERGFRYVLYLESERGEVSTEQLASDLETALCRNFHYAYCRRLGQLAPADVLLLGPGASDAYLRACQARGQRLGNVKSSVLSKVTGWRHRLEPLVREQTVPSGAACWKAVRYR